MLGEMKMKLYLMYVVIKILFGQLKIL